jgi:hypothetical protein
MTIGAGEHIDIRMDMNWDLLASKDWSLTAWGTSGAVSVEYTGEHYENTDSDHMPQHEIAPRYANVEPIVVEEDWAPAPTCMDTDQNSNGDVDGDKCDKYQPTWCTGAWDDDDFKAQEMCCVCDGG